LHSFEPKDAQAIATYLKSRPPVTNRVPPPLKYGFVESIIGKALYSTSVPPIGNPRSLIYKAGNYGDTTPGMLSRDWPQRVLMGLQWLTLATGAVAFVAAIPAGRRRPRGGRGCLGAGLLGLGMLVGCLLLWVMYSTPVLPFVPPGQINQAVMSGIPHPDPAQLGGPEEAALAARGEYLFKVTSCAFCHGAQGAGGAKINMATFGTLWARNITSDRETGLGAWSDAEIARAMRSGVSRAGRPLHWQGMTWDHFSNMDEEDVRAIIVYLRTLPPIQNQIPDPAPPSADDCAEYTFFLVESLTPGCAP
jgi:mono/diheme cytochrome c family protein